MCTATIYYVQIGPTRSLGKNQLKRQRKFCNYVLKLKTLNNAIQTLVWIRSYIHRHRNSWQPNGHFI